jgi:D-arabinose 5-phosphate isomerase GutQ
MAQLCPDAAPLVAAARALDAAKAVAAGTPPVAPTGDAAALATFTDSLSKDAATLGGLAAHYGAHAGDAARAVAAVTAALKTAESARRASATVLTTGIGKSGAVAARFAISLRSLGLRAAFVHGSEWVHGDLGGAGPGDVVVAFSHSGRTGELVDAATRLAGKGVRVFSVTNDGASPLARASEAHLPAPAPGELLGVVPTRSIAAQEAVVNGLLAAVAAATRLDAVAFKAHHPGGSIGGGAR